MWDWYDNKNKEWFNNNIWFNNNKIIKKNFPSLYESPPKEKIDKNLVYRTAEPWAKQNIDEFFSSVFDWATSLRHNNKDFMSAVDMVTWLDYFKKHLYDMTEIDSTKIKVLLKFFQDGLKDFATKNHTTVPEELDNKLKSIFFSV